MLGALLGLGLRYGPSIVRGIGKAVSYARKIGKTVSKVKKVGSAIKKPAQAVVSGIMGEDSKASKKFNEYSDKAEKTVGQVSDGINSTLDRGDHIKSVIQKYPYSKNR